jgi:hypothetical protein
MGLCKAFRSAVKINEVSSVGRLIARRYMDAPELPPFLVEVKIQEIQGSQAFK